ncbi:MAG: hypothetical protein LBG83_04880 [Oscillospiraceae bacterium]|jgi:hypothetical protein|nr:hypothetical protein [Oscillospiraceae bacterium]
MANNTMTRYSGSSTGISSYSGNGSYGLSNFSNNFVNTLSCTNMWEQGRAILASTAMENVGALSAMEGYLCQIAPSGAHRYKLIADAYAVAAARVISDW